MPARTSRKRPAGEEAATKASAAFATPPAPPHATVPLFSPYRSLGIVTSASPPAHQRRGDTSFVTTSAGRAWQVYECGKLTLRAIGPLLPRTITSLAVRGDSTFASCGVEHGVVECHRVHARGSYSLPKGAVAPASNLLLVGDWLLATTTVAVSTSCSSASSPELHGVIVRWRVGSFGSPSAVFDLGGGAKAKAAGGGAARRRRGDEDDEGDENEEEDFRYPTALCHPPAYVDKVLVSSSGGGLHLWNVAAGAKLHSYRGHRRRQRRDNDDKETTTPPSITSLEASPALDVVALGRSDGSVTLLDARTDAELATFEQAAGPRASSSASPSPATSAAAALPAAAAAAAAASDSTPLGCGAISSLAFSTGPGVPLLAVGGAEGGVGIWNLETRTLAGALPRAHAGKGNVDGSTPSPGPPRGVTKLHFFPGEPRLSSSGADNAIRQWALDGDAASGNGPAPGSREGDFARLLRSREGHASPPTLVRFYGDGGGRVLSAGGAGDRSLRLFSCVRDAASKELSQRSGNKRGIGARAAALGVGEAELKLPRVVSMDASQTRERDWANVVTAHEGDPVARTWRVATSAAGHVSLIPPRERVVVASTKGKDDSAPNNVVSRPRAAAATAVCLSACGNFALVGSAKGHVDRYNMQSGRWRQAYRRRVEKVESDDKRKSSTTPAFVTVLLAHDGAVSGLAADVGSGLGGANVGDSSSLSFPLHRRRGSSRISDKRDGTGSPSCGRRAVSAGGADGFVRAWDLVTGELLGQVAPSTNRSPISSMACAARPEGGGGGSSGCALVAAATDDGALSVVDAERCRVVRRLLPPPGRVSDLALSSDGRTLVASCLDGCVAAWDVVAGAALQRVSLLGRGSPVASLALSPDGQMLATAHYSSSGNAKSSSGGVRLWANQAVFGEDFFLFGGSGACSSASKASWRAVRARLPSPPPPPAADDDDEEAEEDDDPAAPGWLSGAGKSLTGDRAWGGGGGGSSDDDDDGEVDDVDEQQPAAAAAPSIVSASDETLPDGAPAPLGLGSNSSRTTNAIQPLATTSSLPRARWAVLPHLDALAARNRPLEPPKKPRAAPFFLPTLPTLDGRPTFDLEGVEEEAEGEEGQGADEQNKRSRIERGGASGAGGSAAGELVLALRAGRKKASASASPTNPTLRASVDAWSRASRWLREARPRDVDRELRSMLLVEPSTLDVDVNGDEGSRDVAAAADAASVDLESLLMFLGARCASGADFELTQAFLTAALSLHGGTISTRPRLRRAAAALEKAVRVAWERLDDSLHAVRCAASYVGGLPT